MGNAPENYTITNVSEDGKKVRVEGSDEVLALTPPNSVKAGQQIQGWINRSKFDDGPDRYLKVAEQRNGSRASNAADREQGQIEGWAHNLAAMELAHDLSHADVAKRAQEILSARAGDSSSAPANNADSTGAEGAESPGTTSGEEYPF